MLSQGLDHKVWLLDRLVLRDGFGQLAYGSTGRFGGPR
jgi:hypothetical protein